LPSETDKERKGGWLVLDVAIGGRKVVGVGCHSLMLVKPWLDISLLSRLPASSSNQQHFGI